MAKLKIRCRLQYMPGPWGASDPVKGAIVRIIDKDPGGRDDVIYSSTTNSLGRVRGTSSDWQDRKTVRYWQPWPLPGRWRTKTGPDPADVMLLEIEIKLDGETFRAPFVFMGDDHEVPIVVPWTPSYYDSSIVPPTPPATTTVNGEACSGGFDLQKKTRAAMERGDAEVTIELRGPEAAPFVPYANKSLDQLKELVDDLLPGAKDMLYSNPVGADDLFMVAVIIVACGVAHGFVIIATGVAVAMILAIILGYERIELELIPASGSFPLPGVRVKLIKSR